MLLSFRFGSVICKSVIVLHRFKLRKNNLTSHLILFIFIINSNNNNYYHLDSDTTTITNDKQNPKKEKGSKDYNS